MTSKWHIESGQQVWSFWLRHLPKSFSFEKTWAPAICARVWSTTGKGWCSQHTFLFSLVRSTHMFTRPLWLGTTTIPAHHSVGVSTGSITPSHSMWSNSTLIARISGTGTLCGVLSANGWAPSHRQIVYSLSSFPSPVKRFGKCSSGLNPFSIAPIRFNNCSTWIVGWPSDLCSPSTM